MSKTSAVETRTVTVAEAKSRVVPAFGHNKDITVYGEHDGSIQATVGSDNADVDRGDEPA